MELALGILLEYAKEISLEVNPSKPNYRITLKAKYLHLILDYKPS